MQVMLYFVSILLTCALSGFLTAYAWRQRSVPGSRAYAGLALGECLLALAEILSMFSLTPTQALFWFRVRYLALAVIPVLWLVFALEYSGRKDFISKRLLAGLFIVPVITQVLLWSNSLHGLWVKQEVGFHRNGPFWIADTSARLPGLGFLVHSFYGLILLLAGIVLLLVAAWRVRRQYRGQALLLTGAGFTAFVFAANSSFNLIPQTEFNLFTPGIGLSVLLVALAVFRFQFLKRAPAADAGSAALEAQSMRSLAVFLLVFIMMAAGIAAVGYVSYQSYEREFRHQVEGQLSAIAELKVNELENWRTERMGDAQVMRQNPAFAALVERHLENPSDTQAQAELHAWLDSLRSSYQYDRVFLLDSAGVERISSPAAPEPVAAHLTQEAAAISSAGQVTFLDFHRDTADGPIYLALLVPILGEQDNRPLGILVLRIDPNGRLYPYIQQWHVSSASAETLLVRREGTDAVFLNELRFQTDTALNLRFPLENTQLPSVQAALEQEGVVEGVDYRGVPVLADVRAVPDSPWFLVAKVDTAEVYVPLRERLWQTAVFFGALIAASGAGLGLVWWQQRVRYYRGQAQAAQALRESLERFQLANRATFNVIWDWNLQSDALWWNENFQTLFGYQSGEIEPGIESRTNRIHPQDVERVETGIHAAVDSGRESWFDHYLFRGKDGQYVEIEDRGYISRDASGKPVRMIGAMQDITERKRQEAEILAAQAKLQRLLAEAHQSRHALLSVVEDQKRAEEEIRTLNAELEQRVADRTAQLAAANQELEAFAYSVSHDLRAPLRAMDGFSAALLSRYSGQLGEQGQHYLDRIRDASQRMGQLIEDLLNLSRVTRAALTRQQVDLSALAREIAAELQAQDPLRQVEFVIAKRLAAEADPHLLRIALENLLDNAWKFTGPRSPARIEVGVMEQAGERVYFVRDNGVGFDMAYAGKLFAPFQRLHAVHEFPGTGIGLATVQRIVARHGGRVWTEAEVERGATFCFTLRGV